MNQKLRKFSFATVALGLLSTLAFAQQAQPEGATAASTPAQEASPAPSSRADSPLARLPVERHQLANGLRVVLSPDQTVPTVAIAVYYDVGSRNEVRGRSGFAHLFEHMMFEGSANVGKGEHFQLIMNRGGSMNGTTSEDRTNYYETLPSNELALGLWLEADRMKSLTITEENFENQRNTVMEERRQRIDNQPYVPSMLRINELAFGDYWPYAHSTIGDMADLQAAPLAAVQEFFDSYYTPNNAVLSISGDFASPDAMELIERYFGGIPSHPTPPYEPAELQPQTEERVDVLADPNAPLPAFHIAYHIPPSRTVDHYALELLALILGDGESSRLYQALVKDREVLQTVDVSTDDRRGPDLFSIWGVVTEGHSAQQARDVIYDELTRIAQHGVTARELEKAHNRVRSYFVFGLASNMNRAMQLGEFELYWGDATLLRSEPEAYLAVTDDDIKRVAKTYFEATNRTVLDVQPVTAPASEGGDQ